MRFKELAKEFGCRTPRERRALWLLVKAWSPNVALMNRERARDHLWARAKMIHAEDRRRRRGSGPYGFGVILTVILFAALSGAITWLVEKILNRWWPDKTAFLPVSFEPGDGEE